MTEFEVIDRNRDPKIKEIQDQLKIETDNVKVEHQKALQKLEKGVGEMEFIVQQVEGISSRLGIGDKEEAFKLLTALKIAENENKIVLPAGFLEQVSSLIGSTPIARKMISS